MRAIIKSCWDKNHRTTFPQKFSNEKLEKLREEIGSSDFSHLYENKSLTPETAVFKREDLRFFETLPKDTPFETFMTIDVGGIEKDKNDPTAFVILKVNKEDDWYIYEAIRFWGSILDINKKIFELYNIYKPRKIGIEREKYEIALMPILQVEMIERNINLPIEELKMKIGSRRSKEDRIASLQGRLESHRIFIKKGLNDLEDEFLRFPRSNYDDLLDCVAYMNVIAHPPKRRFFQKRKPELSPVYRRLHPNFIRRRI